MSVERRNEALGWGARVVASAMIVGAAILAIKECQYKAQSNPQPVKPTSIPTATPSEFGLKPPSNLATEVTTPHIPGGANLITSCIEPPKFAPDGKRLGRLGIDLNEIVGFRAKIESTIYKVVVYDGTETDPNKIIARDVTPSDHGQVFFEGQVGVITIRDQHEYETLILASDKLDNKEWNGRQIASGSIKIDCSLTLNMKSVPQKSK
ncbi:hypothetical protein HY389_00855 [Candidatus Daviesbacteria bacterium]|nr:hypothetical protein [Candidatus Daviesbacteria bacterium]